MRRWKRRKRSKRKTSRKRRKRRKWTDGKKCGRVEQRKPEVGEIEIFTPIQMYIVNSASLESTISNVE